MDTPSPQNPHMDSDRVKIVDAITLRTMAIVRENLHRLREHAGSPTLQEIATKAGVGYGTLHRLVTGTAGPSGKNPPPNLDTLAPLAHYFGLEPWQLLVPNVNPESPPTLVTQSARSEPAHSRTGRRTSVEKA